MTYIAVLGSINADLVTRSRRLPLPGETLIAESFQTYPGGKGANQAVAVARLGQPVHFLGCIGRDVFGTMLRQSLVEAGVGVDALEDVEESSGVAAITTVSGGENQILLTPGANRHVTPRYVERHGDLLAGASMILTQLETPLDTLECLACFAQRRGIPLMLDPAPAHTLPDGMLGRITWLTPNRVEARMLTGWVDAADGFDNNGMVEGLRAAGAKNVVLKLGGDGLLAGMEGGGQFRLPAFPVHPVDTTAAGDALNGGLAAALVRGLDIYSALLTASAVAAISVTRRGAQPSMPSRSEVESFLSQQHKGEDLA